MFKAIKTYFWAILVLIPIQTYADSLPERIDLFASLFDYSTADVSYDIRTLQVDYPTRLLTPESMLPNG